VPDYRRIGSQKRLFGMLKAGKKERKTSKKKDTPPSI